MSQDLANETGSVMLFTLMFILIITVMGLIATQTSVFEVKIAENSRRYSEELASAEAALNHAIAKFRKLEDPNNPNENTLIAKVLNDTKKSDYRSVYYKHDMYPVGTPCARIEVRRIVKGTAPVPGLSPQANNVPTTLPHRYYAGSIDKRRFAITATALKRNSTTLSTTWVQKGISLPVEQDKDIF